MFSAWIFEVTYSSPYSLGICKQNPRDKKVDIQGHSAIYIYIYMHTHS